MDKISQETESACLGKYMESHFHTSLGGQMGSNLHSTQRTVAGLRLFVFDDETAGTRIGWLLNLRTLSKLVENLI